MTLSRRTFLVRSGQAAGVVAASGGLGTLLEAAASPAGATTKALTPVTYQLGWLPNVENGGEFVADARKYFAAEGVKVTLLPGGPTTVVEPELVSGKCLVGLSETDTTARAILQGAKIKTIAATLQQTPLAVASLVSKPLKSPKALYGKKLGIQSFQVDVFKSFCKLTGVDASKITLVPASGDPSILASGQVDALFVFVSNEPITLALKGVKTYVWLLGQYGWSVFGDTLCATEASLKNAASRKLIVDVTRAVIRGWQWALNNPSPTTSLVVNNYGKSLKLASNQQLLELKALTSVIKTPYTKAHGLLKMGDSDIEVNLRSIRSEGVKISKAQLFDTSILAEAYNGKTSI
jgi:ABC-type nitrate/sulfonate/bicarbonate transport system substrate-binding protein